MLLIFLMESASEECGHSPLSGTKPQPVGGVPGGNGEARDATGTGAGS